LSLWAAAGEAGGSLRLSRARREPAARGSGDPERSRREAARRARSHVRRYCAANRLNRFGTLTYAGAGCRDPRQVREHAAGFFRSLRRMVGDAFPYVWVPEWHKGGHGLHLHFAVGRYIPRGQIEGAWGRGFVHIKLLGDLPVGSGPLAEARIAARYLSKYVGKAFDDVPTDGLHRYEVAQGFQPTSVRIESIGLNEALDHASANMGSRPERVWHSDSNPHWEGPPTVWASWPA
jgi:hypothetical protein